MDVEGYCRPGRVTIAERCNVTDRTLDKAVHDLEAAGLLRVKRGKGRQHVNEYQALLKGERRSRFAGEKANETPVKGEPRSHELVELVSGAPPKRRAPVIEDNCVWCDGRFRSSDVEAVECDGCVAVIGHA
jgi:hypothetical protein